MKANDFAKLSPLAFGRITARGWIREQLLRSKDGMGGHLDELEPNMIANPYVSRATESSWGPSQAGWGAEISGNYWCGLIKLAFALDDAELKGKAEKWVDGALKNRDPDGYWGAYAEKDNKLDDFSAWGTSCGLWALQHYYEATGRRDVFDTVYQCLLWFCKNWSGNKKTRYAGQTIITNMAWCYIRTGDTRLSGFIDDYIAYLNENDLYLNSVNAMLSPKFIYNSNHAAMSGSLVKTMAAAYMSNGKTEYIKAAENFAAKLKKKVLLPTGGIASNTEYYSPITSNTETEYCTYVVLQNGLNFLAAVTGKPSYYDITERVAFNGGQGARKKDEKAIAYFSSPNQIFATQDSDFCGCGGDQQAYAPCYPTACCPVYSVWLMPDYLSGMGLTDKKGNLYITSYGPARIDFGGLVFETDTMYPFRDTVEYKISADKPVRKTVCLRIPAWCGSAEISVNGESVEGVKRPGKYFKFQRLFNDGDVLKLKLPMRATVKRLNDADSWRHYPLAVEYGPLVFSLPVPEVWAPYPGRPRTPLPDGWNWYEVWPKLTDDPRGDIYEQQGLRKYNISWNVALDERTAEASVQAVFNESGGYVWEKPPVELKITAYKALFSYAPYIHKTHEVYQAPIDATEKLDLTLVPYGCANLRITFFPRAKL